MVNMAKARGKVLMVEIVTRTISYFKLKKNFVNIFET